MKPVFISVDVEVTDTDPVHGRLMQIGLASESGAELEVTLPVKNDSKTSEWVQENLRELLDDCWRMRLATRHLEPLKVGRRWINGAFYGQIDSVHRWVMQERASAHAPVGMPTVKLVSGGSGFTDHLPPAVMVCYCGGLDFGFVTRAFAHCEMENPFHYEFVEISSLAMGVLKLPWGFKESELEEMLDMDSLDPSIKHNALEDAKHQLVQFQRLMEIDR